MPANTITLTKTEPEDLHAFFQFQLDEEANYLAAFTPKDSTDKTAYLQKFARLLQDPSITIRTIKLNEAIVGSLRLRGLCHHRLPAIVLWWHRPRGKKKQKRKSSCNG